MYVYICVCVCVYPMVTSTPQYFDQFTLTPETGGKIGRFVVDSLDAAALKVSEYLALMPAEERQQASMQLLT